MQIYYSARPYFDQNPEKLVETAKTFRLKGLSENEKKNVPEEELLNISMAPRISPRVSLVRPIRPIGIHIHRHRYPHWHFAHYRYPRIWYAPRPVVYGAVTPTVTTNRCTCLYKEYTPEGAVVFKDLCTNEMAMNPPAVAPTAQLGPQQQ